MTRKIEGLKFANLRSKPSIIGVQRARGAKAHGVRFERALAKAIPLARHGQWFEFIDANGYGFCQTDLLLEFQSCAFVLEAKYTWTIQGHFQLDKLYLPVVAMALGKPTFGAVVCKALRTDVEMFNVLIVNRLMEALTWCQRGKPVIWHWLGEAPFAKLDPGTRLGAPLDPFTPVLVPNARRA